MPFRTSSEPITIRTSMVKEIDALAKAMKRSRNFIVNQAIEQYLVANAWQIDRIEEGIASLNDGSVLPGEDALPRIADKYGWPR